MGKYYMKRAPWGGAPSENDKGREIIEETISDELISVEADDANGLPHFAGLYDAWHFRIQGLFKAQSAQLLGEDASEVEAAKAITDYIQENFRVLPGQKRYQESTLVKIYDLCIKYAEDYAANKA